MANFRDVIGHEQIVDYLRQVIKNKKTSHAYIFSGPEGSGKKLVASAFAKALLCEKGGKDACNECKSCKQMENGNQPDFKILTHEKPNVIRVEEVRTQLVDDMAIKPYSSDYKIYVIDEAEKMNVQAQNAVLKTIEEPPAYGIVLLLVNDTDKLLPTILSRCVTINMKPVDSELISSYLMSNYMLPDYRARICAAFSGGSLGKAIDMATSAEFDAMYKDATGVLKKIDSMSMYEIMDAIKVLEEYKQNIDELIDLMEMWYRDIMILSITEDDDNIIFKDEYIYLSERVQRSTLAGLENIIKAMELCKRRIAQNVNFDTAMEMMLLAIKEN